MNSPALAMVLVLVSLTAGCGGDRTPIPTGEADKARAEELTKTPSPTPPPPTGPAFDPMDDEQLLRVYCGAARGDNGIWAREGLTNSNGIPDGDRIAIYQGAIKKLARDAEAWSRFLQDAAACKAAGK